ncbi:MAG: PPOX class F420-dependent oxidoreductase [Acidimicrobiia bacterium]|nr:PPOX class F420-dependent oxidoreductase [Acidimicrobiia bacterium]
MTEDEWRRFLVEEARPAVLATTRPDGRPHAAPVWFDLDGDTVVFMTGADTVKGRNLAHDPRLSLCVQDDRPPFSFALLDGIAEVSADPDQLLAWATRIGGRYMGDDRAEEYGRRNGVPGEVLVRVAVTHVVAARDVAD